MLYRNRKHKVRFTTFIRENIGNPRMSRDEYVAAIYLLTAEEELWKKVRPRCTSHSVNFRKPITGVSTDGYALYKTAREIYTGIDYGISISDIGDPCILNDGVFSAILTGLRVRRYGIGALGWR